MKDEQIDALERALGYPFAAPARSFALVEGREVDLTAIDVDRSGRTPLLAYGSNASPPVLARKLGPDTEPVPVVRAVLSRFDVVYSAHIAAYGSVPATLRRSPGTELFAFVAYLTTRQVKLISETEPNYELGRLDDLSCRLETGEELRDAAAYLSRHGCLLAGDAPVAVREVPARRRALPEMSQRQVLEHLRDLLRPELDLEQFVLECVSGRVSPGEALDRGEAP
ncbi:MAG TPA: hypothetical protein VFZ41_07810 [Solirubrobacterales bacterium]